MVFVAQQEEPVRRRVALKVIKPGMDTKRVIARFEAERQALALMDHPNIARVFDAGATDKGRPYFVMELVEGVKITDYCDRHSPTRAVCNRSFNCDAIQICPPERDRSSRHQAIEYPRDERNRREVAGIKGNRLRHAPRRLAASS